MENIEYIVGNNSQLCQMSNIRAWKPFDARVINFCDNLSQALLSEMEKNIFYSDLVTLAFWIRKNNQNKIRQNYTDIEDRLGNGLVFHITPGNIPLSFAYSLITGLLTGNVNIIRLSSRKFEQADIFCNVLKKVLEQNPELSQRICIIRYPHDKNITDKLSKLCKTRIIWGGDNTIDEIRRSPLPPRANEITFANRFSVCLIDADAYLSKYDAKKVAHEFYIDTYLTDQNACSSPRIIFWCGKNIQKAKEIFWRALYNEIRNYDIAPVTTVNKLLTFCKFAAENECTLLVESDYKIVRVAVKILNQKILENIEGGGYFYEYDIGDLSEIFPICTWELQTFSHIGFDSEKLRDLILNVAPSGVDRIVPVGSTMNFGFIWDGRDIVREMTRKISVQ